MLRSSFLRISTLDSFSLYSRLKFAKTFIFLEATSLLLNSLFLRDFMYAPKLCPAVRFDLFDSASLLTFLEWESSYRLKIDCLLVCSIVTGRGYSSSSWKPVMPLSMRSMLNL